MFICGPSFFLLPLALSLLLAGCNEKVKADPKLEAPPPAKVESELDASLVKVDHPEQFPLVTASKHAAAPEQNVTGTVNPDVSRAVPVISLASGRIIEIRARLGDTVTKGQLMMRVQSPDISQAFSDHRQALGHVTAFDRGDFNRHRLTRTATSGKAKRSAGSTKAPAARTTASLAAGGRIGRGIRILSTALEVPHAGTRNREDDDNDERPLHKPKSLEIRMR